VKERNKLQKRRKLVKEKNKRKKREKRRKLMKERMKNVKIRLIKK